MSEGRAKTWMQEQLPEIMEVLEQDLPKVLNETELLILKLHVVDGQTFPQIATRFSEPWTRIEEFAIEAAYKLGAAAPPGLAKAPNSTICGKIAMAGFHGEPLACGWERDHDGPHSWASLPSFPRGGYDSAQAGAVVGAPVTAGATRMTEVIHQ